MDALVDKFLALLEPNSFEDPTYGSRSSEHHESAMPQISPESCLDAEDTAEFLGGGEEILDDTREVFSTDREVEGFVVTKIFGDYDRTAKRWKKAYFPIDNKKTVAEEKTTFTIPRPPTQRAFSLPKPTHGYFDPSTKPKNGRENILGELSIVVRSDNQLEYDVLSPDDLVEMENVSTGRYQKFIEIFKAEHGNAQGELLVTDFPEEVDIFLSSIKELEPAEKVMRIEEFVREICHYDLKNQEVLARKIDASIDERLEVMEDRLEQLRQDDEEHRLSSKKYAGVCSDFATLTVAILRKAGFLAGMAGGFAANGTSFQVKHNHAVVYVIWPDKNDVKIFTVDGTPPLDDVRVIESEQLTLRERRKKGRERKRKEIRKLEEEVEKSLGKMSDLDIDDSEIEIDDGKLRSLLKKLSHLALDNDNIEALKSQLDFYLYSPIHDLDLSEVQNRVSLKQEITRMSKQEVRDDNEADEELDQKIYLIVHGFLERIFSSHFVQTDKEAMALLKLIIDSAEQLEPIEKKAIHLIARNFFKNRSAP